MNHDYPLIAFIVIPVVAFVLSKILDKIDPIEYRSKPMKKLDVDQMIKDSQHHWDKTRWDL